MAKTESTMLALGTQAPYFSLINTIDNKLYTLNAQCKGMPTVIMFLCNHCPYVKHSNATITALATKFITQVRFIAISSNDITTYPDDAPENMRDIAQHEHYPFPYLYDASQSVAKAYHAACTPDFYLFDHELLLVYRGQLDDSRPGNNIQSTGFHLYTGIEKLLSNQSNFF